MMNQCMVKDPSKHMQSHWILMDIGYQNLACNSTKYPFLAHVPEISRGKITKSQQATKRGLEPWSKIRNVKGITKRTILEVEILI